MSVISLSIKWKVDYLMFDYLPEKGLGFFLLLSIFFFTLTQKQMQYYYEVRANCDQLTLDTSIIL